MALLEMKNICKSFYGIKVLDRVSFNVDQGEVHALLGENGAGKSTLMNILGGVYTKDEGNVIFDGHELINGSIKDSENSGIAFVHQELNVFNNMTVSENLFLCNEYTGLLGCVDKKRMVKESRELFERLGVSIDPEILAGDLDMGSKQTLEIAKALHINAKLIILDEPTTALNNDEIEKLFQIIKRLKKEGTSFVFISHKMPEIFRIADRYTVLRNAKYINSDFISNTTPEEVAKYMVGENYVNEDMYVKRSLGDVVLELKDISGEGFEHIDLTLRRGEIVALTGLQGAGCSQVLQTVFGAKSLKGGEIKDGKGKVLSKGIHNAMLAGIAMVPSNRKENSVIPQMTILENTYISEITLSSRAQHINRKKEKEKYDSYRKSLNIKAGDSSDYITSLSGGNQQKIILARWLNTKADILLFDNPTQGIDVGAKSEIYRLILELAKQGKTIMINTLEIPEIQKIADRCIVFYHGQIAAKLDRDDINDEKVMLYATNAVFNSKSMIEEA